MVPAVGFEPTWPGARGRAVGFGPTAYAVPPHWDWSARGDSNPDLHGLNVPRLPIAPRADGDHGRTRTATEQALDLLPLPDWATWPLVPLGGLEPPPHGLRARRAALTPQRGSESDPVAHRSSAASAVALRRSRTLGACSRHGARLALDQISVWSEWRDSNPHLKAWKARRRPLPHIRSGPAWAYTQAGHGPVSSTGPSTSVSCQRSRSCEHVRSTV